MATSRKAKEGIDAVLDERGSQYGPFTGHALITQGLKRIMHTSPNWSKLHDDQKEALEMVAHKIGRLLNGNPDHLDGWVDAQGYLRLVELRLTGAVK